MRSTAAFLLLFTIPLASPATAGLVPGGGKARSDCYAELQVTNLEAATVKRGRIVTCRDGDACDLSACGDDACTFEVGLCVNQVDPSLVRCTPPTALSALDASGPIVLPTAAPPIEGAACFAQVAVDVPLPLDSKGRAKTGSAKFRVEATAAESTRPGGEVDRFVLKCTPRPDGCANTTTSIASSTTSTTAGTGSTSTVPSSSSSSTSTSTSTSLVVVTTSSSSTSTTMPAFDCAITTATCITSGCTCPGSIPGLDYHLGATGTGHGPVGTQVRVNTQLMQGGVIDCGQWTKIGSAVNPSCDTIGCCERQNGQPESMVWTVFENFDLPCYCPSFPGITVNYDLMCQYLALPVKEYFQDTTPCP